MKIIKDVYPLEELKKAEVVFDGPFVKGVVDVKKEIIGVDAEMHADIEQQMLANGSEQDDLWGINLYFDDPEDMIEYDSMINIRPRLNNRSRSVEDPATRDKIKKIVEKWIK